MPRNVVRKKTEEKRQEVDGFLCIAKRKEEPRIYTEIIAVEGLKKNRKAAVVTATAMMEPEDKQKTEIEIKEKADYQEDHNKWMRELWTQSVM